MFNLLTLFLFEFDSRFITSVLHECLHIVVVSNIFNVNTVWVNACRCCNNYLASKMDMIFDVAMENF